MPVVPLFPAPVAVCSRMLNTLLRREDWANARLARHAGKTVHLRAGRLDLRLTITSAGTSQPSDPAIVPDVTLTVPGERLGELPALIAGGSVADLMHVVRIEGDAGLAQTVSDLARDLRWDVEHDLAGMVGDIGARRLLDAGRTLFRTARESSRRLGANVGEFLSHESGMMANRPAATVLSEDLQILQGQLARLEARLDALEAPGIRRGHRTAAAGKRHHV